MQVEVEEEEIRTEEFQEGSGWTHVVRKAKIQGKETTRPPTPERQSRPRERDKYAKKVIASTTRASKMPNVLPREDIKIVVRPRGGLNIAKRQATVATAIRAASGDIKGRRQGRHVLPKCTPEHRGDSMVKGIIRGVPVEDTPAEIHRNIVHPRNPLARRARRIGNTTTAIAAFEGLKVPNYVCYETEIATASIGNKVPYVVTRRQWERKTEEQRARRQLADPDEFPKLGTTAERAAAAATERSTSRSRKNSRDRSASKRRSASRQCGRSKPGERVGWTDAVKAGIRKREPSLQQSLVPSGGSNSGDKKTDKRDEEMELLKKNVVMLTRANEVLKRKIAELVAALDMSNKENTGHELGSDHYIVEIAVPLSSGGTVAKSSNGVRTHKVTDWDAFRGSLPAEKVVIEDIEEWTAGLTERAAAATREIETDARMEPRRADEETAEGAEVPECVRRHVQVRPIPNNVNPEYNRERRAARARALIDLHARDSGAVYVDAAEYKDRRGSFRRGSGQRGHQRDKGGGERAGTSSASGRGGSHRPGSRRPRMHDRAE
ncbi:hypothetical protein MTO96_015068 [Rhipicephalus appendiculatus]